jgi:hypothetical protein
MNKEIYYKTPEGQSFQEKPHVSFMPSGNFNGTWRVDLRWREDSSTTRVDAEFNFVDGMDFYSALEDANEYGKILNVPVASYNPVSIGILFKPEGEASKDQEKRLKFLMQGAAVKKFSTH